MLVGALLLACTHIATCVHGTVHERGGVQAQQILLGKNPCCHFKLTWSVLTQNRRDQLEKLNSKVRGLNKGPCTQDACVRARLDKFLDFLLS